MSRALARYRPLEIGPQLIRAAQYVRMSTEHQRYSPLNQKQAITDYAREHGFMIVRTYADEGKSGLQLKNRPGLQQMLDDVIVRRRDYEAILVLDVSRWGRFQDTDESAAYEYICKKAGVRVLYCAEPFPSDSGPLTSIMKVMKRSMAAEFSRELSVKTHRGICRVARKGYWGGGPAGYGLRRMLVQEDGQRKTRMNSGQHKSLSTDRVILVPGPHREVATVRKIFRLYAHERVSADKIALELNKDGSRTTAGRPWHNTTIFKILKNEKYVGTNIYNRTSGKLGAPRRHNHPREWVCVEDAFEPIVSEELFQAARHRLAQQTRKLSNAQLLDRLRDLLRRRGHLNTDIINEDLDTPNEYTYRLRFGSVARAYAAIGFSPRSAPSGEALILTYGLRRSVLSDLRRQLFAAGVISERISGNRYMLRIGEKFTLGIVAAPVIRPRREEIRWVVTLAPCWDADLTVALRLNAHKELTDFYLLPGFALECRAIRFGSGMRPWPEGYRCSSLETLVGLVAQAKAFGRPIMECHQEWALRNCAGLAG